MFKKFMVGALAVGAILAAPGVAFADPATAPNGASGSAGASSSSSSPAPSNPGNPGNGGGAVQLRNLLTEILLRLHNSVTASNGANG